MSSLNDIVDGITLTRSMLSDNRNHSEVFSFSRAFDLVLAVRLNFNKPLFLYEKSSYLLPVGVKKYFPSQPCKS